jgi:hypothetical protein
MPAAILAKEARRHFRNRSRVSSAMVCDAKNGAKPDYRNPTVVEKEMPMKIRDLSMLTF